MRLDAHAGVGQQGPSLPKYKRRHLTPPDSSGLDGENSFVHVIFLSTHFPFAYDKEIHPANVDPSRVGTSWSPARGKRSIRVDLGQVAGSMLDYLKRSQDTAAVSRIEVAEHGVAL